MTGGEERRECGNDGVLERCLFIVRVLVLARGSPREIRFDLASPPGAVPAFHFQFGYEHQVHDAH